MKLTRRQQIVLDLINAHPGIADDEMLLLERYWLEIDHWDDTKSLYWNLQRSIHPESLSRIRRWLFENGLITYSDKALKSRTKAMVSSQNQYGDHYERMAEIVKPKYYLAVIDGEAVMVVK